MENGRETMIKISKVLRGTGSDYGIHINFDREDYDRVIRAIETEYGVKLSEAGNL
jgi:hypothetical protein